MGRGPKSLLRYPKLVSLCLIYVVVSVFFILQTVQKPPIENEQKSIFRVTVNTIDKNAPSKFHIGQKHVSGQDGKKSHLTTEKSNLEEDVQQEVQCNMPKYIDLNKDICDTVSNKGNNTLISSMIAGKNSILKRSNENTLKNLAGNIKLLKDIFKPREDYCNVDKVTDNCDSLKKSYLYGKSEISIEEELFPLAFAMKIHTNANQAHRLLRYIYRKHNIYCIHVDKKSADEIYKKFKRIESCFDNIIVIEDRINVVYSTIRQVEAELKCMKAVSRSKVKWKYYINLTGQEFMLKTNLEIVKILQLMNGTNDIESYPVPPTEYHKFKQRTFIMNNSPIVTRQKKKPFQNNIKIHKGSAYGLFSRKFVNFILNDYFVDKFLSWLKDCYAPEELIWATLQTLPGTPGGHPKVNSDKDRRYISRAVKWKMDETVICHGKHVHWICIYGLEDIPWLLSNKNIVANKFYEDYEPLALDCIEKEMYNRLKNGGISEDFDLKIYNSRNLQGPESLTS